MYQSAYHQRFKMKTRFNVCLRVCVIFLWMVIIGGKQANLLLEWEAFGGWLSQLLLVWLWIRTLIFCRDWLVFFIHGFCHNQSCSCRYININAYIWKYGFDIWCIRFRFERINRSLKSVAKIIGTCVCVWEEPWQWLF